VNLRHVQAVIISSRSFVHHKSPVPHKLPRLVSKTLLPQHAPVALGSTPLHLAAIRGHEGPALALLEHYVSFDRV
jgi:ankyrin repeat protein